MRRVFRIGTAVSLSALYVFLAARRIDLVTADLGRHLTNGRLVLGSSGLLSTNFYSYTFQDFPCLNHHWGSGLLFYWIERCVGFAGLSVAQVSLGLGALWLMIARSIRGVGWTAAAGAGFLAIPLITQRQEIRPEVFSYFFCALFFWTVSRWQETKDAGSLWVLPISMIVWVNLHIYFVLGFFILGCWCAELFFRNDRGYKVLLLVIALCACATIVNPLGIRLALVPLGIFKNYGYMLAENQSVAFFLRRGTLGLSMFSFVLVAALSAASLLISWRANNPYKGWYATLAIGTGFGVLGFLAIRNFPLAGLFSIPLTSGARLPVARRRWAGLFPCLAVLGGVSYLALLISSGAHEFGLGLNEREMDSARFFKEQRIEGPIFNNYDIGGYLIYGLFPAERVFVDNRPEAYPARFFTETYVPMQESEEVWKRESARFGFNVIYFFWHDQTPWAQDFLIRITHDPGWVPIYVDPYALILVRNTGKNQGLIDRFRIPGERFGTRK